MIKKAARFSVGGLLWMDLLQYENEDALPKNTPKVVSEHHGYSEFCVVPLRTFGVGVSHINQNDLMYEGLSFHSNYISTSRVAANLLKSICCRCGLKWLVLALVTIVSLLLRPRTLEQPKHDRHAHRWANLVDHIRGLRDLLATLPFHAQKNCLQQDIPYVCA